MKKKHKITELERLIKFLQNRKLYFECLVKLREIELAKFKKIPFTPFYIKSK